MGTAHRYALARLGLLVAGHFALVACDPGTGMDGGVDAPGADAPELDGGGVDGAVDDAGALPEDTGELPDGELPDAACSCPPADMCFVLAACEPACTYVAADDGTPCDGGTCSDGACIPDSSPTCGDGVRDQAPVREGCDDGNESTMDSCDACVPQVFDVSGTEPDGLDFPPGARTGIGVDGTGAALYVWTAALTAGLGAEIRARAYEANGAISTGSYVVIASDLGVGVDPHPTIVGLQAGGWVVAWEDRSIDMSDLGIAYRIVRAGGTVGAVQRANETRLLRQHQPALAATATGFLAAWTDDSELTSGGASRIVVRHFPTGSRASAEVVISDLADASEPAVATDATGHALVAYTDRGAAPGFARALRGRVLTTSGGLPAPSTPIFALDGTASESHSPAVASLLGGGYVAAWASRGRDPLGDVRVATVTTTGVVTIAFDTGAPPPSTELAELEPSIAGFPDGSGYFVTYTIAREDTGGAIRAVGTPAPEYATLSAALAEGTVGDISAATGPDGVWLSFGRGGLSPVEGPIRAVYGFLLAGG
jgi:hypothetical protein